MTTISVSQGATRAGYPTAHRPSRTARVAAALGRIEARRLLRSPMPLGALALAAIWFGPGSVWPEVADLRRRGADSAFMVLPLAAAMLIVSLVATLRPRRHGTQELLSSTPVPEDAVTAAHLVAPSAIAAVAVVPAVASVAAAWWFRAGFARADVADLAVAPLLVAGAGALGVLLARWFRTTAAGIVACVVIAYVEASAGPTARALSAVAPSRRLKFWFGSGDLPAELLPGRLARWHVVYLIGLVASAAVGALAWHGLRRKVVVAGMVALALVSTSAWFQTRPVSASASAARNELFVHPEDHQVCDVLDGVRYCAYPAYRPLTGYWAAPLAGVRRGVPPGRWPTDMEVHQRLSARDVMYAPAALAARVPAIAAARQPPGDDGHLHTPMLWDTSGRADLGLALLAAARTVGLPLRGPTPASRCDASGQARAVVALWLTSQATPKTAAMLRRLTRETLLDFDGRRVLVIPDFGTPGGVAFGETEVALALDLLGRPQDQVVEAMAASWGELTAPATPTAVAAARLGLPSAPPAPFGPGGHQFGGLNRQNGGPVPGLGAACGVAAGPMP